MNELPNCYRCGHQPCECRDGITLYCGDCLDVLPLLEPQGACVTDPPYGIGFMGKAWDGAEIERQARQAAANRKPRSDGFKTPHDQRAAFAGSYDRSTSANRAFQAWCTDWATALLSALLPGAPLLAFGGTRTWHRLACGIEDAGFELRDTLMWLYGSGFPKSLDVSKAIDKAAGAEREQVPATGGLHKNRNLNDDGWSKIGDDNALMDSSVPATEAAQLWDGWGTAMKPAWEAVILAMKPLDGTYAENAVRHGVAGLNVDGARVGIGEGEKIDFSRVERCNPEENDNLYELGFKSKQTEIPLYKSSGRWPANVILSHHPECVQVGVKKVKAAKGIRGASTHIYGGGKGFTEATGEEVGYADADGLETVEDWQCHPDCPVGMLPSPHGAGHARPETPGGTYKPGDQSVYGSGSGIGVGKKGFRIGDSGSAARFFYVAKASGADRGNLPAEELPLFGESIPEFVNTHPTVKPLALMRYLLTLVAMPTDVGLIDPFAGSGTTGVAAKQLGRRAILIESEEKYCELAAERLRQGVLPLSD